MNVLLRQGLCRLNVGGLTAANAKRIPNHILQRPVQCVSASTNIADKPGESFWDKNQRLARPTSPHLTIYKWEITASMSIAHRTSGLALASGLYAFGIGALLCDGSFPHYVNALQAMHWGAPCIFAAKFILAYPLVFHLCSGTRHLLWDMGKGFEIKSVYLSGYMAIATSIALAAILASL